MLADISYRNNYFLDFLFEQVNKYLALQTKTQTKTKMLENIRNSAQTQSPTQSICDEQTTKLQAS